jgi:hypothetical protein
MSHVNIGVTARDDSAATLSAPDDDETGELVLTHETGELVLTHDVGFNVEEERASNSR